MTKRKNEDEPKGPVARDANPERYGAGEPRAVENGVKAPEAVTDGDAMPVPERIDPAMPGEAHPTVTTIERDPIIDRDPGDESFLRERVVTNAENSDVSQEAVTRDEALEGLHFGPGGRRYLVLNLTDDGDAQSAARAYADVIRKQPGRGELAAELFRLAGVNMGRL